MKLMFKIGKMTTDFWKQIDKEFELLKEYMSIYIQIISEQKLSKHQLPSFDYFKENYNNISYSMVTPNYKESVFIKGNQLHKVPTHGVSSFEGVAYRYYNYWLGVKYYTNNNIKGIYTINEVLFNEKMKQAFGVSCNKKTTVITEKVNGSKNNNNKNYSLFLPPK